jgi:hypothetical protein
MEISGQNLFDILPILFVSVIVIMALREFLCWYFKINERRDLLKKIEENTRKVDNVAQ